MMTSSSPVISPLARFAFHALAGQSNTSQEALDLPSILDLERRGGCGTVPQSTHTLGETHSENKNLRRCILEPITQSKKQNTARISKQATTS